MKKIWQIKNKQLGKQKIDDNEIIIDNILSRRGIVEQAEKKIFLAGGLAELADPFLMPDMKYAVERIKKAIEKQEKIIIYGDYDVDGITSTALLSRYFNEVLAYEVDYYVPDRVSEGYGLNSKAVKKIAEAGYQLMITVDCGITALEESQIAKKKGLDLIITDHHTPRDKQPDAVAVINPLLTEKYPKPVLAGVGVAFKLCQALEIDAGRNDFNQLMNYLPIVALGTVADLVSLRGENRIIVKEGLQQLKELKITGLKVLIDELKLSQEEMTSGQIGYILAPPLNAAGRIANPTDAVNLLISDDPQYCKKIANELVKVNQDRRQEEKKIYNEAVETIENNYDLNEYSVIVLASENWHQGVIGIVASRLVEKYYLPVVMISLNENQGKASCRSINKLNLFQALEHCEEFLLGFGGHAQAAGLSISKENINSFRNKLNKYIKNKLSPTDFMPKLKLDLELELEQINFELAMKLDKLRPFGLGNPAPKFLLRDIRVSNIFTMGKENQHLKFYPCAGITAIGFGFGELALEIENKRIDLACQIEVNNWLGKKELQLKVNDINLPEDPGYLPIDFWDDNLIIADKRMTKWREKYLLNRKNQGQKIGVYINQKPLIDKLLNKEGFYKLSLIKESKEAGIYLFNKIPNEKIEVDQLILYSLPFSFAHLNKILKYVAISEKRLILLFTDEEKKINHKLIQMNLPNREFLRQLYRFLSKNKNKIFSVNDLYQQLLDKENVNKKSLQESLQIFTELNLIKKQEEELIFRESKENKLDLSDSLRYNKLSGHLLDFEQFARFAYQKNLFELMSKLKKLKEDTNEFER